MSYVKQFCEQYGFDHDAVSCFEAEFQHLKSYTDAYSIFNAQLQIYRDDHTFDHAPVFKQLHELQETTGIHKHTIDILYLICMMPVLKKHYEEERIKIRYFDNFAYNLKSAVTDCRKTYGVWGTSIAWWFIDFFKLKLFTIGRLQYRWRKFLKPMACGQLQFNEGEYYADVHIPSGGALTPESCHASYAEAAEFFRKRYGVNDIIFCCHSWLLSPDLDRILPANSNILTFAHDYTILETIEDTQNRAISFIFNVPAVPKDIDELPENTSLRQAIKDRLKEGKTINNAFGAMLYKKQ